MKKLILVVAASLFAGAAISQTVSKLAPGGRKHLHVFGRGCADGETLARGECREVHVVLDLNPDGSVTWDVPKKETL